MTGQHVGIPWYERADYERLKSVVAGGQNLPNTFDEWLELAEKFESECLASGNIPHRAPLNTDNFFAWATATGSGIDSGDRVRFAANPRHWQDDGVK